MKHKVSELTGALLDAAVAKAASIKWEWGDDGTIQKRPRVHVEMRSYGGGMPYMQDFRPSFCWLDGGTIIERERIATYSPKDSFGKVYWIAGYDLDAVNGEWHSAESGSGPAEIDLNHSAEGPTALVAAMRSFVTSKLGKEVEIP